MKTIGLVGGVASGKSLAAKILVELGAVHLDADRAGHAVLENDSEVHNAIRRRWGAGVFAADGSVDRSTIAGRVFGEGDVAAADRKFLEELLHPRIGTQLNLEKQKAVAAGKAAVVLDAPVLLEAGWGPLCDLILMIDTPRELRLERAKTRGWTEAEFDRREVAQWPTDKKRRFADEVIPNQGSEQEFRSSLADFWAHNIAPTAPNP